MINEGWMTDAGCLRGYVAAIIEWLRWLRFRTNGNKCLRYYVLARVRGTLAQECTLMLQSAERSALAGRLITYTGCGLASSISLYSSLLSLLPSHNPTRVMHNVLKPSKGLPRQLPIPCHISLVLNTKGLFRQFTPIASSPAQSYFTTPCPLPFALFIFRILPAHE